MNKIKELRKNKGITQEKLGQLLNIKNAAISKYETGRTEPPADALRKMAEFFNVTTDYILGRVIPGGTIVDKNFHNEEIAQLMKDSKFRLLKTAKDLTYEELRVGIELARTIKREYDENKKAEN